MDIDVKKKIKIRLIELGLNQADIARSAEVTEAMVSLVIRGRKKSKPVASHIESILGVSKGSLFSYLNHPKSQNEGE